MTVITVIRPQRLRPRLTALYPAAPSAAANGHPTASREPSQSTSVARHALPCSNTMTEVTVVALSCVRPDGGSERIGGGRIHRVEVLT